MLSEAEHLQYLLENTQMQILRFAQDDNPEGLFPQPVKPRPSQAHVKLRSLTRRAAGGRPASHFDCQLLTANCLYGA